MHQSISNAWKEVLEHFSTHMLGSGLGSGFTGHLTLWPDFLRRYFEIVFSFAINNHGD